MDFTLSERETYFRDRVRERDLDNFLIEELHASAGFRDWFVGNVAPAFTAPVAAAGAAAQTGQQTLDMNQPRWPEAMIQRIEMLRDMADANDMSIRLVPDALGAIDISLRRDGDTVQVQLTAEQPRTRALLAEAQPQLTDMAEARGLKLQQTPAATGSDRTAMAGQQQQQSQAHQQAHQQSGQHQPPRAPAPAPRPSRGPADSAADDDERIA
mgnify:CR=1 FL=1